MNATPNPDGWEFEQDGAEDESLYAEGEVTESGENAVSDEGDAPSSVADAPLANTTEESGSCEVIQPLDEGESEDTDPPSSAYSPQLDLLGQLVQNILNGCTAADTTALFESAASQFGLGAEHVRRIVGATYAIISGGEPSPFTMRDYAINLFGGEYVFMTDGETWRAFTQAGWVEDPCAARLRRAIEEMLRILRPIAARAREAYRKGVDTLLGSMFTTKGVAQIVTLMNRDARVHAAEGDFDKDDDLLGVPDGVVDLRTGEFRLATPQDRVTRRTRYPWIPEAPSARWDALLEEVLPDPESRALMQRLLGQSLSGGNRGKNIGVFIGPTNAGKGLIAGTAVGVLGDYGDYADRTSFLTSKRKGSDARPDLHSIKFRRLVTIAEMSQSDKPDHPLLKTWSGGIDSVPTRDLYGRIDASPAKSLIIIQTNELPRFNDHDGAMWERLVIVPFLKSFVGPLADRDLPETLKAEGPGILQWMYRGYVDYTQNGLAIPDSLREYRGSLRLDTASPLDRWSGECLVFDGMALTLFRDLRESFVQWHTTRGLPAISDRRLSEYLQNLLGLSGPGRASGNRSAFPGIRLATPEDFITDENPIVEP